MGRAVERDGADDVTDRNESLPPQLREALDIMGRRGKVAELTAPAARTPYSEPDACDPVTGEPCDRHETEQAHAEGEHAFCGTECEVEFPTEQLRNFIVSKGYPGTAGMLDELLRRAAAGQPVDAQALRADLAEARATIARVRHALMNQSYSTSLENTILEALDGSGEASDG